METNLKVIIKHKDSSTMGELVLVSNSPSERLQKALKVFCYGILATIGSIFIPMLHFVLVPLFLLISLTTPILIYFKKSYIKGGTGPVQTARRKLK